MGICRWSVSSSTASSSSSRLNRLRLLAQQPAFFLAGLAFGGVLALPIDFETSLALRLSSSTSIWMSRAGLFQLDEAVDVDFHAAVGAVLRDEFGVFDDEFAIEHGRSG